MQKLDCVLQISFNNDELTSRAKNIKKFHTIETKSGIRNYCHASEFTFSSTHGEGKEINVSKILSIYITFRI